MGSENRAEKVDPYIGTDHERSQSVCQVCGVIFVLGLMFAYEETVEDKDDNDHDDFQSEYGEWGCARACVKTNESVRKKLLVVAELVGGFHEATVGTTAADEGSVAGKGGFDGRMALGCLCEGEPCRVDGRRAAKECLGYKLDTKMVCSVDHA